MGWCSAINCVNHSNKHMGNGSIRASMYRLPNRRTPKEIERRLKWIQNSRRKDWNPESGCRFCELHFENSQFYISNSGKRMLKKDAVPTLFNVPNPPKRLDVGRKSVWKKLNSEEQEVGTSSSAEAEILVPDQVQEPMYTYTDFVNLTVENKSLKTELQQYKDGLARFLNDEQVHVPVHGQKQFKKWENSTLIKALKFCFALGKHGFEYIHDSQYPLPSYCRVFRRIQDFQLQFGIFHDLLKPLQHKVEAFASEDIFCALLFDEMEIDRRTDYEKNTKQFYGKITLGNDPEEDGTHLLSVLVRGIKNPWKQVVGAHITGRSTSSENVISFLKECITFLESNGLFVVSITNDMGPKNQGIWSSMGVRIMKYEERRNKFVFEDKTRFCMPDVCHLVKNLKHAVMKGDIQIPEAYRVAQNLQSKYINGKYIRALWVAETKGQTAFRSLNHLKREDMYPDNYQKMNVGAAIRFFSDKTAAAIELGVYTKLIPSEALTTAHFIRLVEQWFQIVNSKTRKTAITMRNKEIKFACLQEMIDLFQDVTIGKGWKPLNTGIIMASLSAINIVEFLFENGYEFVILHRFTRDAIENVFSQVRRRSGQKPSALEASKALKTVCLAQFISDVRNTYYSSDNDLFLLDSLNEGKPQNRVKHSTIFMPMFESASLDLPAEFPTVDLHHISKLSTYDLNILYNIAGSITGDVMPRVCDTCSTFLNMVPRVLNRIQIYKNSLNKRELKDPCNNTLQLLINCELLYREYRNYLLHNNAYTFVRRLVEELDINFPQCCNLKSLLVNHFVTVRSYAVVSSSRSNKRRRMYGSSSAKKQKT